MSPVISFLTAIFISYILVFPTIIIAKKLKLVTDSKKRTHPAHTHKGIIPRAGGFSLYLTILLTTIIFLPINKIVFGILLSSALLVIIGLLDDYFDLSPYWRFIGNIVISIIVIGFGLGIPYVSNPFGGVIHLDQWKISFFLFGYKHTLLPFADLLAIFWLSWTTNMINWSKGVDGQLPGFVAIAALFLGLLSQRFTAHDISAQMVMIFAFIVSGAYFGFLPFNYYPQKIMPGYGGGALAGFLLGILSILSFGKIGTSFLILSIPMIDALYMILKRVKRGASPFKASWGHFHHKLLEIGWGKRRIAFFYWFITFILGIASLLLKGIEKMIAFITIALILLLFILIIDKMKKTNNI
ncbi:hypothetical protein COY87_00670 [Candidatus Roizmanbacteria bacterium CG_4_10_14_0_8_um_filter_33_9]|uniref:Undecaprenyl-phosphate alpha-N-acetylglucosaminyl 1-phosphate transferase n=1 Tax=Candidatus Roizmanbacteria bacterium CG_4_10_14_0_8_um_filter_33_9 TaxID=1974826 RepID=A0A2M7QKH8_9BACT|nr:MAG: hypothetical protein COY87_00670 [Candidatus Roizmanbacteria bacterium CG_4_10_14_0_8_um_filter_33_9]